jgi:AraC-like DNA-binding protein
LDAHPHKIVRITLVRVQCLGITQASLGTHRRPTQVLRRYRLHEAADRLSDGDRPPWAELAAELGYADQSHFFRDFSAAVGATPAEYAAACEADLVQLEAV